MESVNAVVGTRSMKETSVPETATLVIDVKNKLKTHNLKAAE